MSWQTKRTINKIYRRYLNERKYYMRRQIPQKPVVYDYGGVLTSFLVSNGKMSEETTIAEYFEQCAAYGLIAIYAV